MSIEATRPGGAKDDLRAILAWLEENPTLSRTVGAARRLDKLGLQVPDLFGRCDVLFVRNFTLEPMQPLLKVAGYRRGLSLGVDYSGYDPALDSDLDELISRDPDVVVVALRVEELAPAITRDFLATGVAAAAEIANSVVERVAQLVRGIRARCRAAVLVHNFASPVSVAAGLADSQDPSGQLNVLRRMNLDLAEHVRDIDGAHIVDIDHLFAQLGLRQCRDERGDRLSGAPLSQPALRALAELDVRHILALHGPAVKCVVVDCDNTLWGGVVGEDGLAGIVLGETGAGRRYRDLQQNLLDLRRRGTVLAICSKNEQKDVLDILRTHPEIALHEQDFAAMRINWDDKATNIESIAAELNLGLAHLAFIDDNPVECEWVRTRLPQVRVIQWPADLGDGTLDDLGLFDSLIVTEEDRTRTEMMRAETERRQAREDVPSVDDYLRSLNMVAVVGSAGAEQLPRLAQLTQKTNQFNLTTRRYDVQGLDQLREDPDAALVWLELRDRFGSNGLVGCGILRRQESVAVIDTLLLSCRVLGRGAEALIVHRLAIRAQEMGALTLVGEYIPSERNAQVAELYDRLGFQRPASAADGTVWHWSLEAGLPEVPDWFEIIDADKGDA